MGCKLHKIKVNDIKTTIQSLLIDLIKYNKKRKTHLSLSINDENVGYYDIYFDIIVLLFDHIKIFNKYNINININLQYVGLRYVQCRTNKILYKYINDIKEKGDKLFMCDNLLNVLAGDTKTMLKYKMENDSEYVSCWTNIINILVNKNNNSNAVITNDDSVVLMHGNFNLAYFVIYITISLDGLETAEFNKSKIGIIIKLSDLSEIICKYANPQLFIPVKLNIGLVNFDQLKIDRKPVNISTKLINDTGKNIRIDDNILYKQIIKIIIDADCTFSTDIQKNDKYHTLLLNNNVLKNINLKIIKYDNYEMRNLPVYTNKYLFKLNDKTEKQKFICSKTSIIVFLKYYKYMRFNKYILNINHLIFIKILHLLKLFDIPYELLCIFINCMHNNI